MKKIDVTGKVKDRNGEDGGAIAEAIAGSLDMIPAPDYKIAIRQRKMSDEAMRALHNGGAMNVEDADFTRLVEVINTAGREKILPPRVVAAVGERLDSAEET